MIIVAKINAMKYILTTLVLFSFISVHSQSSIWIADFSKVKNGHRAEMLYYLENNWKLYRDSALAAGHISAYRLLETTADSTGDFDFILLTEFPDSAAYAHREALFEPIMKRLRPTGPILLNGVKIPDIRELKIAKTARTVFAAQARTFPAIHIDQKPEHLARLREINRDIWTPFSQAYAGNNADLYVSLHAKDFIRANGGKFANVQNLEEYEKGVKSSFARRAGGDENARIDFTFFERYAGAESASERGIYRYTAIRKDGTKKYFYGKFHVFHRKVDGVWKISVDYDSNEDGTIGEADFRAGVAPGE